MSRTHRLLAIAYPPVDSLTPLLDGLRDLPIGVNRAMLRTIARVSLKPVTRDRLFWRDFYFRAIAALTRRELVARYALSADARDSLTSLYPDARVHTFQGAGHAMSAERRHEWAAVIAAFLT